ncbi:hypothetical protein [Methanobrevibacter sp.]|uniref:hypothetical protein n=1 Tax=Methanobrevibacter sp. TaxID=66852 RepID=UPI0038639C73
MPPNEIMDIKDRIRELYDYSCEISESEHIGEKDIIQRCDELYGNLLLKYIKNHHSNIRLTKKDL